MIKLDISDAVTLAYCTLCHWRQMRPTRTLANQSGLAHLWAVHPDQQRAIDTAHKRSSRHRHAD